MLLCREEGLTESLPSPEMFEPGVLNKRPRHHAATCTGCVCSPRRRGHQAPEEPTNGSSLLAAGKTKPHLLRQAPPFPLGLPWKSPAPDPRGHCQTALLSDKGELGPHQKESPSQGWKQERGSSFYLTTPSTHARTRTHTLRPLPAASKATAI